MFRTDPKKLDRTNWSQEHHEKYSIWRTGCSDNHNPGPALEYHISESIQKSLLIRRIIVAWTEDPIQNVSLIWLLRYHNPAIGKGICVMFRSKTFLRIVRSRISRIKVQVRGHDRINSFPIHNTFVTSLLAIVVLPAHFDSLDDSYTELTICSTTV